MKMIAGLGNPGQKYLFTRHNIGFMALDVLAGRRPFQKKQQSLVLKTAFEGARALLIKPQTFMNRSGQAIKAERAFYKIPLSDLLVIHDDKDLRFGQMKFQKSRGHGGQGGIRNIIEELGSKDFCRLKIGIAPCAAPQTTELKPARQETLSVWKRLVSPLKKTSPNPCLTEADLKNPLPKPKNPSQEPKPVIKNTSRFVLSPFSPWEQERLPLLLEQAGKAVRLFVAQGFQAGANRFNSLNLFSL